MDLQSSGLLESASNQLSVIQDALRDAQGRQSEALQRAKDVESAYHREIDELKGMNKVLTQELVVKQSENDAVKSEIQKSGEVISSYKSQYEALHHAHLSRESEMQVLAASQSELKAQLVDKDRAMKRSEQTFQQLISDLTDSVTKTRMSNSELTDKLNECLSRMQSADAEAQRTKTEAQKAKADAVSAQEEIARSTAALAELKTQHVSEVNGLKDMLNDYSSNVAEMKPVILENQTVLRRLAELGYKQDMVRAFEALCADSSTWRCGEVESTARLKEARSAIDAGKTKHTQYESQLSELKRDMQRLNDMYTKEREANTEAQRAAAQLQDEMMRLEVEAGRHEQERRKHEQLQGVNEELNRYSRKLLEEKAVVEGNAAAYSAKLAETETRLAEVSKHCWDIAEEFKQMRQNYADEEALRQQLQDQLALLYSQQNSADHLIKNLTSSLKASENVSHQSETDAKEQLVILQEEANCLREILQTSTEEKKVLEQTLHVSQVERQMEKSEVSAAIHELTEAVHGAKSRNEELSGALLDARTQLEALSTANSQLEGRVEELDAYIESESIRHNEAILEYDHRTLVEASERDDLLVKLSSAMNQIQVFQIQLKESQTKHWETIQNEKHVSLGLRSELERAQSALEDMSSKVELGSSEQAGLKDLMHREISMANNISNSLRDELEKRLNELLEMRKERDTLSAEKEAFLLVSSEREKTMKRNEVAFQKALEADRAKLQQELKTSLSRVRVMEGEKEELLKENEQLSIKLMEDRKEVTRLVGDLASLQKTHENGASQCLELQSRLNDALKELKDATRTEFTLREEYAKAEKAFKEELMRVESLVKEAKRSAASQISQISSQIRIDSEEIGALKRYNLELADAEKRLLLEVDKLKSEIDIKTMQIDNLESKFSDDAVLLKAELKESKAKVKCLSEEKSALELQLLESKMAVTKAEGEINRWSQHSSDIENKVSSAESEKDQLREKVGKVMKSYNDLKLKYVEVEEEFFRLKRDNEELNSDLAKAEREGMAEARGLRVALASLNIEHSDMKVQYAVQNKELEETKSSLTKLHESSTASMNSLLDELRIAEDAFAEYRKTSQSEGNDLRHRVKELSGVIELSKGDLDELYLKSKADKSERDMRVHTLENELSRLKSAVSSKDERIYELEKVQQESRNSVQKLKQSITELERKAQDADSLLQAESQIKKRLELKIHSLEVATAEVESFALPPPRRLGSSRASNQNGNLRSPIKRQSFDDFFEVCDSAESNSKSLILTSDNIDRVTQKLAAKAVNKSNLASPLSRSTLSSPDRKKISRSTKGLVSEVREIVSAASKISDFMNIEAETFSAVDKNEYELSIERTQQFLKHRLAAKASKHSNSASALATPNNGANFIFEDVELDGDEAPQIQVPRLDPVTPPHRE